MAVRRIVININGDGTVSVELDADAVQPRPAPRAPANDAEALDILRAWQHTYGRVPSLKRIQALLPHPVTGRPSGKYRAIRLRDRLVGRRPRT